jgi:hypothetical protein
MARCPQGEKNLSSREELDALKLRLSLLSPANCVRNISQARALQFEREVSPPYVIQRLVVMWGLLWSGADRRR